MYNKQQKVFRCLFCGSKPIGEKIFKYLINQFNIEIKIVVSNENTKETWWKSNKIYKYCKKNKIQFYPCNNTGLLKKEITNKIKELKIDLILSVQTDFIFSKEILQLVNHMAFNLHVGLLPNYKGWNAINHSILNNEKFLHTTLHWINSKIDGGDICYLSKIKISNKDTAISLYKRNLVSSFNLFKRFWKNLDKNNVPRIKQIGIVRYYKKDEIEGLKEIKLISEICSKSRAFYFPGFKIAYLKINNKKIYIKPFENQIKMAKELFKKE